MQEQFDVTTEMAISATSLVVACASVSVSIYLVRSMRIVGRRAKRAEARLVKIERQLEKHRTKLQATRKRLAELARASTTVTAKLAPADRTQMCDAHRLATESARAVEHLLMDVNTIRRDVDAVSESA